MGALGITTVGQSGVGGIITPAVDYYADLPPALVGAGKIYFVKYDSNPNWHFGALGSVYKYPRGQYISNGTEWALYSRQVQVSEDSATLINIPNYAEWFSVTENVNIGDIKIFDGIQYQNITGTYTLTIPSLDEVNWTKIKTSTLEADYIDFDENYIPTGSEPVGSTYYDSDNETLSTVLPNGVIGQHFQEQFIDIENKGGATLYNGAPIWYAGTVGNSGLLLGEYNIADGNTPGMMFLGINTQDILNDGTGKVSTQGKVRGIQTDGVNYGETWVDGDIIYVSDTTPGALTNIMPQAPSQAISVAVVISSHGSNGTLFVRPQVPAKLTDLSDVNGEPLVESGQVPTWNNDRGVFDFTSKISDNGYEDLNEDSKPDLAFDNSTRTFSTSVKAGQASFHFWVDSVKYIKTATESVVVPDITGSYYIIFDNTGTLIAVNQDDLVPENFYENAITGLVYWNATAQTSMVGGELHGKLMDARTHHYNHSTFGARYEGGFDINGLTDGGSTYDDITSGYFWDEDVRHSSSLTTSTPFIYRLGADGAWTETAADLNISYNNGGTYDVWNEWTGTEWVLSEGGSATDFWIIFTIASPDLADGHVKKIIGQNAYPSRAKARAALDSELSKLATDGLPSPEFIFLHAWIAKRNGTLEDDGDDNTYIDLRAIKGGVGSTSGTASIAANVSYSNTTSGLTSTNVQDAIDELAANPGGGVTEEFVIAIATAL